MRRNRRSSEPGASSAPIAPAKPEATNPAAKRAAVAIPLVFIATMFDYLAVGMMRNLLPWYAKTLGGGAVLLGTLETAYGVGQVVGASFLGRLSDVHGRRLVVFISGLGSALGYGMSAGATTATMLIASRIPVGLAKQTVTVSRAILADCTPVEKRTGIMTQLMVAIAVGYAAGPIAGAKLAASFGESAPAITASSVFLCLVLFMYVFLPETSPKQLGAAATATATAKTSKQDGSSSSSIGGGSGGDNKAPAESLLALLKKPAVAKCIAATILPEFSLIVFSTTAFSMFAMENLDADREWLGYFQAFHASCTALAAMFVLPALASRGWSDQDLLRGAYLTFGAVNLSYPLIGTRQSAWAALVPMACSTAVLRSCPASFASKLVGKGNQGGAFGALDGASSVCRVVAPLFSGHLIASMGVGMPFYLNAVLCAGGAILMSILF